MSDRKTKDKWGATRGKLALVAVLSMVLVMVIVGQLPGSSPVANSIPALSSAEGGTQTRTKTNSGPKRARKPSAPSELSQRLAEPVTWPKLTMQEVLQHDPFVVPSWAAPEKNVATTSGSVFQPSDDQLQQLQQQGASVVVISSQDKIATIGDHQIRIGDSIQGYSVIDITPQGIVLADPESR